MSEVPKCSTCKAELALADGGVPEPQSILMCWCCGHLMAVDDKLDLRELTPDEARICDSNKALSTVRLRIRDRRVRD